MQHTAITSLFQQFFPSQHKLPSAPFLLKHLHRLKLPTLIGKSISDPRSGPKIYSLTSLITGAVSTILFRCGSKRTFESLSRRLCPNNKALSLFLSCPDQKVPATKTIDDVLSRIHPSEFDDLLFALFQRLTRLKFFLNHTQLMPMDCLLLAVDAEAVHTYAEDSAHNSKDCPYCLKRHYGGTIRYLHVNVVASVVCPGNIRIPLFHYPVHARSGQSHSSSADAFKQECELSAFPNVVSTVRKKFPNLKFCVLLDSLYPNGPVLDLLDNLKMHYVIVRKAKCPAIPGN